MYTFNYFIFGHDISDDIKLSKDLWYCDIYYVENINGKKFEFEHTYHGGRTDGHPCIFGTIITDDDNNKLFIDYIRTFKEEDYIKDYNTFISNFKKYLIDNVFEDDEDDDVSYEETIKKLIQFIDSNKPLLYSLEASS